MLSPLGPEIAAMTADIGFTAKGVGEIVLRVRDLDGMIAFYRRALGLELLRRVSEDIAFLRVAEGFGGHTQIVGFFATASPPISTAGSGRAMIPRAPRSITSRWRSRATRMSARSPISKGWASRPTPPSIPGSAGGRSI